MCELCEESICDKDGSWILYIENRKLCYSECGGYHDFTIPIKYCPMCGKKL